MSVNDESVGLGRWLKNGKWGMERWLRQNALALFSILWAVQQGHTLACLLAYASSGCHPSFVHLLYKLFHLVSSKIAKFGKLFKNSRAWQQDWKRSEKAPAAAHFIENWECVLQENGTNVQGTTRHWDPGKKFLFHRINFSLDLK